MLRGVCRVLSPQESHSKDDIACPCNLRGNAVWEYNLTLQRYVPYVGAQLHISCVQILQTYTQAQTEINRFQPFDTFDLRSFITLVRHKKIDELYIIFDKAFIRFCTVYAINV